DDQRYKNWLRSYRTTLDLTFRADLAQLVEQLPRKEQVTGSNPVVGSVHLKRYRPGAPRIDAGAGAFIYVVPWLYLIWPSCMCTTATPTTRGIVSFRCPSGHSTYVFQSLTTRSVLLR